MKPKPLDLEEKELIRKFGYDESLNLAPLASNIGFAFNDNIKGLIKEVKQRIKSACEFYLRYKDNPELLIKEHLEFKEVEKRFLIEKGVSIICPNCKKENILILRGSMIRHEKEFPAYPRCIFEASLIGNKTISYEDIDSIQCKFCGEYLIPNSLIPNLDKYNEWLFKLVFDLREAEDESDKGYKEI